MNHEQLSALSMELNEKIEKLQLQLKTFPPGKLIVTRQKTRTKWYVNDGTHTYYLPKSRLAFAERLAQKKYLTLQLKKFVTEKRTIDSYLRHYSDITAADQLLCNISFQKLLSPFFQPASEKLIQWQNTPYERNMNHPEQLLFKSPSGNTLRSKSELIIDMALFKHKIPFRYECSLHLGEIHLYQDFTILHPHTGKIHYWEHYGLMDHPNYAKNAFSKLELYNANNICPSIDLITTFETKKQPLQPDYVENLIRFHFS